MADETLKEATERARGTEEQYRLLIASVRDYAIFMANPEGVIVTWNAGAQLIKGYRADEAIGKHISLFYTPEDRVQGRPQSLLHQATAAGQVEDEGWRVRKDGSLFWADVVITALWGREGELVGFTKVTRDLTERRRLEEERLRVAQAQEAIRLRDEFLSIVSHELKTPLTALLLQLQSLQERLEGAGDQIESKIQRATRSGDRLADLIESLLDISHISTGRFVLAPERFDLAEAVGHVVESLRGTAMRVRCEINIKVEGPVPGAWDRMRIEQVMMNLLSNALKYGAGAPVEVSVRQQDVEALIEVRDHGPGIPEQDIGRIFGRFERAASMRHYGGLGIGLYVIREVVNAHGGSVAARNAKGGGACFTVRLPIQPREPVPGGPAAQGELQ